MRPVANNGGLDKCSDLQFYLSKRPVVVIMTCIHRLRQGYLDAPQACSRARPGMRHPCRLA